MNNQIEEKRKKRLQLLYKIYEVTGGSQSIDADIFALGKEQGLTVNEISDIQDYLEGKNLLEHIGNPGIEAITIYGIEQVENAIANPDQETIHLPAFNIINIQEMHDSQIQQNTVQSTQTVMYSANDLQLITKFIEEFRNHLPELLLKSDTEQEAIAEITTLEAQVKSPKPKPNIIKECLKSLRSILENTVANVAAAGLLALMKTNHLI